MKSRAKAKRAPKGTALRARGSGGGSKRARTQDDFLADDAGEKEDMFAQSDSDAGSGDEDDSGSESDLETAQEKKLRVAKAYLQQLREAEARQAGSGSDEDATTNDAVAQRLRGDAMEALGQVQRNVAYSLAVPALDAEGSSGRLLKCHRHPVTAVALTSDEATAYSVSKGGFIVATDVESGSCVRFSGAGAAVGSVAEGGRAEWVAKAATRAGGPSALLAAAVTSDGRYLAVGGGDRKVHIWDARSQQYVQGFPQHRDVVTGLAFREGTHELFSGSFDRTVKLWSLDDRAYVDTLFGHQSEVVAVDVLRQERVLTSGQDRTCRVWKVPEESQLIFRGYGQAIDTVAYVTGTEWLSGGSDGGVSLWSQMKKKPISVQRSAHTPPCLAGDTAAGPAATSAAEGPGSIGGDCASWVSAVACARGTDVVASGAGDGVIRLWQVAGERGVAGRRSLKPLGGLPARGFVNGLQLGRSGQVVVAAMGQEPRLGRWSRDRKAKNGLLIHRVPLSS